MKKINFKFLQISLISISLIILFYSLLRRLDNDEFEAIHTAWKVLYDGQIFKDFFQHHHPLFYYFLAPFIKIFGASTNLIYLFRFFSFLMFLGIGYATYFIAKIFTNKTVGILSVLFLFSLPIFTVKAIEIRPDIPMVFCSTLAIALWYRNRTISSLLFSGSFLFLQKAGSTFFFFGILVLVDLFKKRISLREIFICTGIFFIFPLIYLGYLLYTNSFGDYITFCWIFNFKMIGSCPALPSLKFGILSNIPFWIFFIIGLIFSVKERVLGSVMFLFAGLTSIFFVVPFSYSQYLLPALPFAGIITGFGFYSFIKKLLQKKRLKIVANFLVFLIIIPPIFTNYARRVWLSPVSKQIAKINYVLSITDENDIVLDSEIGFDAFNLFRHDSDFFWFSTQFALPTYNLIKPYKYDVYKIIEEKKPKAIGVLSITKIGAKYKDESKKYIVEKNYKKSDKYDDLLIARDL